MLLHAIVVPPTALMSPSLQATVLPLVSGSQVEWLVRLRYVMLNNLASTYSERRHLLGQLLQHLPTDVPAMGNIQIARLCVLVGLGRLALQPTIVCLRHACLRFSHSCFDAGIMLKQFI